MAVPTNKADARLIQKFVWWLLSFHPFLLNELKTETDPNANRRHLTLMCIDLA